MAEADSNTKWPLLNQLPEGPIKENLIEIQDHLEAIEKAMDVLRPLALFSAKTDTETITIANETVFTLAYIIDAEIDGVFYNLDQIFESQGQDQGDLQRHSQATGDNRSRA